MKVAINGFGRIGRLVLRAYIENPRKDFQITAINGPATPEQHAHLFKYDSLHGTFRGDVKTEADALIINGHRFALTQEKDPTKINWDVDVVLECSGKFTKKADALLHLKGNTKKVLVSAPSPDADSTIVFGVNNEALKKEHTVISVGSCTTNCLAPVAKVLNDTFGIESGFMTTIHAYTGDQNIHDGSHKDMRRARAAGLSMVPTSTGAAKALGLVIPELVGKLNGTSIRVPTPNVSMIDLTFNAKKPITKESINAAMKKAASNVLGYSEEELVSIDYNHSPFSSIFDATQTFVVGDKLGRVAAWYDNEWGFSLRMLDVAGLCKP
jgi:glyceraldehyde 3-phosphate dehydrogenase